MRRRSCLTPLAIVALAISVMVLSTTRSAELQHNIILTVTQQQALRSLVGGPSVGIGISTLFVGPHAIGVATNQTIQLRLGGTFTGTSGTFGLEIGSTYNAPVGGNSVAFLVESAVVEAGSGTHSYLASGEFIPVFTSGAASTTDAVGVKIRGFTAPSGTTNASGLKIDAGPTSATNNYALWAAGGSFRFDGTGPHSIGGAVATSQQLILTGTFTAATLNAKGLHVDTTINAGADSGAIDAVAIAPLLVERGAGTHTRLAALRVLNAITAGAAAATDAMSISTGGFTAPSGTVNASSLKIDDAPTGATNNYALWVSGGVVRLSNTVLNFDSLSAGLTAVTTAMQMWTNVSNLGVIKIPSGGLAFDNSDNSAELMRLTDSGILALATAVTTGAAAGDAVLANAKSLRAVNAAASTTRKLIGITSGDVIQVAGSVDIIALGDPGSVGGASAGDVVLANAKLVRWANNAGTSAANYGISGTGSDGLNFELPATNKLFTFGWAGGTTTLRIEQENGGAGIVWAAESSADHTAPAANSAVMYTKDNGAGKTQLCARFNTGAVQCFATEP